MEDIIHILPEFLANQIAAGEVVQRPESVVKELVENSLDSNASMIAVVVKNAGKSLIHIIDNGKGMSKNDVLLSVKRHATSKIRTTEDLHKILTLGFRGEALASISAVAALEIRTQTHNADHGWKMICEPMKESLLEPYYGDAGTQVFVRNLFYNTPARKKFLRTDLTEFRNISETMIKFALSAPHVRFIFCDDKMTLFDVPKQSLEERIGALYSPSIQSKLQPLNFSEQDIQLEGFIGAPSAAQPSRTQQHFYLNGRSISHRALAFAVSQVYEPFIPKGHFPFYVINIKADPEKIDVNVHPQKHEVKFDNERFIFSMLQKAVTDALHSIHAAPNIEILENNNALNPLSFTKDISGESIVVNKITGEIVQQNQEQFTSRNIDEYPRSNRNNIVKTASQSHGSASRDFPKNSFSPQDFSAFEALFAQPKTVDADTPEMFVDQQHTINKFWQIQNAFIAVQTNDGLIVFDQQNAHKRILYDKAIQSMTSGDFASQELLFPVVHEMTHSVLLQVSELSELLHKLGFRFETHDLTLTIYAVPNDVPPGQEETALLEMMESLSPDENEINFTWKQRIAKSYAQHNSVKSGQLLPMEFIRSLYHDIALLGNQPLSPDGKQILLRLTIDDFTRIFQRFSSPTIEKL